MTERFSESDSEGDSVSDLVSECLVNPQMLKQAFQADCNTSSA